MELGDIPDLETCFEVNIHMYELQPNDTVIPVFISTGIYEGEMYLNVYKNHLSYNKDFKGCAKKFTCVSCQKMFKKAYKWRRFNQMGISKYILFSQRVYV